MTILYDDTAGIAQGLQMASGALSQALQQRAATRLQEKQQQRQQRGFDVLGNVLQQIDLTTPEGQKQFLQAGLQAGQPAVALEMLKGQTALQKAMKTNASAFESPEQMAGLLKRFGIPEEQANDFAEFYGGLSEGGKTQFASMLFERMQRGEFGRPEDIAKEIEDHGAEERLKYPQVDPFRGLTPKERTQRQSELFKSNREEYDENRGKIRGLQGEQRRLGTIKKINERDTLPTGLGRFNVDLRSGELLLPSLANPDTQMFVKTINDWTVNAKDSYGGRVTNFELNRFMKRLPSLLNSPDGRRLIIRQMEMMQQIDLLERQSLQDVYRHYGLRNIDPEDADRIAQQLRAEQEDSLIAEYENLLEEQDLRLANEALPDDLVIMEFEGKTFTVPRDRIQEAQKMGAVLK